MIEKDVEKLINGKTLNSTNNKSETTIFEYDQFGELIKKINSEGKISIKPSATKNLHSKSLKWVDKSKVLAMGDSNVYTYFIGGGGEANQLANVGKAVFNAHHYNHTDRWIRNDDPDKLYPRREYKNLTYNFWEDFDTAYSNGTKLLKTHSNNVLVGHSWGGDSALEASPYAKNVITLDPVGWEKIIHLQMFGLMFMQIQVIQLKYTLIGI
jgi:hypothetical protein